MSLGIITTVNYEGTNYESLNFVRKNSIKGVVSLTIESADIDGDVEIEMEDYGETHRFYLDQEALKKLITHLQKQVK